MRDPTQHGIRVLHVLGELRASGAEIMLRTAYDIWRGAEIKCDILALGPEPGEYAKELREAGYHVYHLEFRGIPELAQTLTSLVQENRYHIVHIHTEARNYLIANIVSRFTTSTVIRTIHAVYRPSPLGRLKRRIQRCHLQKMGVQHVAVSPAVKDNEDRLFGNATIFIPNWYDSERFRPPTPMERERARQRVGIENDTIAVTSVGNCAAVKRHEIILRTLPILVEECNCQYLHVGSEDTEATERRLAKDLAVEEHVDFLGVIESVDHILAATDVFVMPSSREGFGLAALEAMGMGIPSVLARVPGLQQFCNMSAMVRCIDTVKPGSLKTAIQDLGRRSYSWRQKHAVALSNRMQAKYGLDRGPHEYIKIYRSVA